MTKLKRTRTELASFLRIKRESLNPESVGLPQIGRRRTPGLRREEVAALAGVGLTWYTWLEQGREIGVSAIFLDNLAKVLKLNAAERRHLYLLIYRILSNNALF
ncbi:helix-turn-helix domain-containing protein [Xenorhabdus bovienii]|nr:helix-turn-helix domain-containing protein [Xenorhabdus bovienii]